MGNGRQRTARKGRDPGAGRDEISERGGERDAEPVPAPHISPPVFKFLSAANCVLHVFPWTCDRKLTSTAKRPHKENICRRVVARKRIDRVIILSEVEGK